MVQLDSYPVAERWVGRLPTLTCMFWVFPLSALIWRPTIPRESWRSASAVVASDALSTNKNGGGALGSRTKLKGKKIVVVVVVVCLGATDRS